MNNDLPVYLESALSRLSRTQNAIDEVNLMWAMAVGDPKLLSDLRHSGLNYESCMDAYYEIRDSEIQVARVRALSPPTEYVLRNRHGKDKQENSIENN